MTAQIRNYRKRDLDLLVVLLNSIEAVDRVEQGTSLAELREELASPDFKPEENAFVVEDDGGRLMGYAGLILKREADEAGFRSWFNLHPICRGRGLEDRLLARIEERALERMSEVDTPKVYLSCDGHLRYTARLRAMERAGMKELRRFWVMRRPNLDNLPMPQVPAGLVFRSNELGRDDAETRDAFNDSFRDHFAHSDAKEEGWKHYLSSIHYRPELSVLAVDPRNQRVAGFCHIAVNEGECRRIGRRRCWIDILGVRRDYRRQGLGEALILQGMRNLRAAGMQEATLGCDSENTTNATRLYFRVGFQVLRENILFSKYLREELPVQAAEQALALVQR